MLKLRYTFFILALAGTLFLGLGANAALAAGPNPVVIMETTMGRIIIMLYPKEAPVTCMNFLRYVDEGFYDGTVFHRVVKMEVDERQDKKKQQAINIVQGGGYVYPLRRKAPLWGPIPNEGGKGLNNVKGTVSMARGSEADSAQCEFFFNVLDNPGLNPMAIKKKSWEILAETGREKSDIKTVRPGYCAFAKVIRGMEVVEKIHDVETERMGRMKDVPVEPVFIKRMYRAK
jgi:peptidyl-prolyl cis-trans isomerase A (cyclophilin A)/peptidyl-prolyl cis-trans isomerase B (cyclophilin B)